MSLFRANKHGYRGGFWPTAVACALVIGGLSSVGVSLASQKSVAEPSLTTGTHYPATEHAVTPHQPSAQVTPSGRATENPQFGMTGRAMVASKPVRLDIPSIDVHSSLQHLGQAADGSLEVPEGERYNDAAWYRYSPTPGSIGPAVLLGHVDSAAQGPSVFFRLGELVKGDRISVERADGSVAEFEVDEVRRYPKDDFPTRLVYGDIDHAGLRILTCGGAFDESSGHYLDNIVVFATLI